MTCEMPGCHGEAEPEPYRFSYEITVHLPPPPPGQTYLDDGAGDYWMPDDTLLVEHLWHLCAIHWGQLRAGAMRITLGGVIPALGPGVSPPRIPILRAPDGYQARPA